MLGKAMNGVKDDILPLNRVLECVVTMAMFIELFSKEGNQSLISLFC